MRTVNTLTGWRRCIEMKNAARYRESIERMMDGNDSDYRSYDSSTNASSEQ